MCRSTGEEACRLNAASYPTAGIEIQQTRPCAAISPEEMNAHLRTVMVATMPVPRRAAPGHARTDAARAADEARRLTHARRSSLS
jgi:mRNA-degrading endonuclease toxin of MazEF toxin-antitoxin module